MTWVGLHHGGSGGAWVLFFFTILKFLKVLSTLTTCPRLVSLIKKGYQDYQAFQLSQPSYFHFSSQSLMVFVLLFEKRKRGTLFKVESSHLRSYFDANRRHRSE
jgi:hypothetical protein